MKHFSTRGHAPALDFDAIVTSGLAPDGGLYMPEAWQVLTSAEWARVAHAPYAVKAEIMLAHLSGRSEMAALKPALHAAYGRFDHAAVAPLKQIDERLWLLELFHGPTLAFKDFALQVLGAWMDEALGRRHEKRVILAATSGDTGSAAIAALAGRPNVQIVVLHPKGRVSDIQRRQMTTVADANVHNIALEGSFDDAQRLVKTLFADAQFAHEVPMGAVNSINWARIALQTVYFAAAALHLSAHGPVNFSVPTGNFGDIFAGFVAKKMGAPIAKLIAATNENDIVARAIETGRYQPGAVRPTISPSMDIQVSSNFERLLFELMDRDGDAVQALMKSPAFAIPSVAHARMKEHFMGVASDETRILNTMRQVFENTGEWIDPHTAAGVAAAKARLAETSGPLICCATAHPAKFPEAVKRAIGAEPPQPRHLAGLGGKAERFETLPNDLNRLKDFIRTRTKAALHS